MISSFPAGSAAAVALGLAAFAHGSDFNGSLRIPASFCGVCSLRASRGRMAMDGHDHVLPKLPLDWNALGGVGVSGIIARTVADVKFVMEALFPLLPCEHPLHKGKIISSSNKGPYTFGVWTSFSGVPLDERIRGCMEAIPSRLKSAGGLMSACLTKGPSLNLTRLHKSLQAFYSGRNLAGNPVTSKLRKKLDEARNAQSEGGDIVDAFLENEGLVGLIAPVCAILPHEHNFDHQPFLVNGVEVGYWRALTGYVAPFSVTGNPVVTLRLGFVGGRPLGIQVVGRRNCDEELLRVCTILDRQLGPISNLIVPA